MADARPSLSSPNSGHTPDVGLLHHGVEVARARRHGQQPRRGVPDSRGLLAGAVNSTNVLYKCYISLRTLSDGWCGGCMLLFSLSNNNSSCGLLSCGDQYLTVSIHNEAIICSLGSEVACARTCTLSCRCMSRVGAYRSCDFTAHMCTGIIHENYKLFVNPLFKTNWLCTYLGWI